MGATFVGGLTIGFLPGVASATAPEPPAEQSTTAFCANVPADYEPFTDVTGNKANIECASAAGLTRGTSVTTLYNPGGIVSRAQMATFIARLIDTANDLDVAGAPDLTTLPPYDGTNQFTDDPDPAHVGAINRLADAGIVLGGPGGLPTTSYGGGLPVQRDQMASFINRAQDFLAGAGFSSANDYFTDDDSSVHEDNINAIASEGIAIGDGVDTYNPSAGVNRDQMASFLVRHLAVNHEAGVIGPVPNPSGNASLTVSPADDASLIAVLAVDEPDTSDDRQYTASGLTGASYGIGLFEADNVTLTGSTYTFADADDDDVADPGTVAAEITVANGAATGGVASVDDIAPVSGQITFTVDGDTPESVTPVVYAQTGADVGLDLDASEQPSEAFGVGGTINYVPAEAANGAAVTGPVDSVDKAENSFASATATYFYDTNDTFSIVGDGPVTFATFEAALSSGDGMTGSYTNEPTLVSTFDLTDDNPTVATVTGVTSVATGASVAYTAVGPLDSVNVLRALSGNNTDCAVGTTPVASYAVVGSDTDGSPFVDTTVARPEQYCYNVASVNDGDTGASGAASFIALTAADAASPTSVDVRLSTSAGLAGQLDIGDAFKVAFSEPMGAATVGDSIVVHDADGTFATISCGNVTGPAAPGATFCLLNTAVETLGGTDYPIGQVVTVSIGVAPTAGAAGSTPGLQIPTTISDQGGFGDVAGNAWNIAGSADVVIDVEA